MELLAMLGLAKQLTGMVVSQASLMQAQGQISQEDFDAIKAEAGQSDAAWDDAAQAARDRLAGGGGT